MVVSEGDVGMGWRVVERDGDSAEYVGGDDEDVDGMGSAIVGKYRCCGVMELTRTSYCGNAAQAIGMHTSPQSVYHIASSPRGSVSHAVSIALCAFIGCVCA